MSSCFMASEATAFQGQASGCRGIFHAHLGAAGALHLQVDTISHRDLVGLGARPVLGIVSASSSSLTIRNAKEG